MADEDLTIKARIDDELSRPLEDVRERVESVGDEAARTNSKASRGSRGWDLYGRATEKAGRLAHRAGRLIKGAAVAVGAGIAATAYAAGRLAMSSIDQASNLAESLNAVNVTYGKQAKAVKQLGREAAKSLGLSNVEFNGMAVQFSAFATAIGGEGRGAVKTLDTITKRAADFASVMNLEVAESAALFQSGLAGETEPLRKYGIDLSAATVTAHAYAVGIAETGEELTENQKVQARYSSLMAQTSKTHKDFANTSDSLANQQRILGARFDNAQAKLGRGLLPTAQKVVQWGNREGIPMFLRLSDWFTDKGIPAIGRFVDKARTLYAEHGPQIKQTLGDVRDVAQQGADVVRELADAFVSMPGWARKLLVGGLAGGVVAKRTGLLGLVKGLGKGAGGVASLASKAKPLPVWVVNNGTGAGGLPGDGPDGKGGKGGKWGKWLTRFGGASAITAGPALAGGLTMHGLSNSQELARTDPAKAERMTSVGSPYGGVWGQVDLGPSAAEMEEIGKRAAAAYESEIAPTLDLMRAKAAGFGEELDLVGARKIKPTVKSEQIDRANDAWAKFTQYQIDAGRPIAPYINTTSIERAIAAAKTLADEIHAIPTAGVDGGVNYISGAGASSGSTSGSGGRGGKGGGKGGGNDPVLPNATDRRGSTVITPTLEPRRASSRGGSGGGSSTVNIAPGGVVVNNPSSDVDVKRAIADYVREREERR